ncbi:zinc finger protein [Macleaya cordata]|uniref:Zinc finger protein n=1 Tax=Macleaya cordata TaxID=56857 RepID=A0A200QMP3_MACCD|nr:zinc finger protein [Macleaya cordata]
MGENNSNAQVEVVEKSVVTKQVTEQVTEQVTRQGTEQGTQQGTQQETEQGTEQVKPNQKRKSSSGVSQVWDHFKKVVKPGTKVKLAFCKYCNQEYSANNNENYHSEKIAKAVSL